MESADPSRKRPFLPIALAGAIAAVSTASILIRLAQEHAPSITIAAFRLTVAATVLAPIAVARSGSELRRLDRRRALLAAASGTFLAIHFATWITSLEFTTVASSVVLVSTGPLWVALLAPATLHERLGRAAVLGLILAVVGGIIISLGETCSLAAGFQCAIPNGGTGSRALWGNFLALAGAWAVSGYLILGRHLRATLSVVPYIFVVYSVAALLLLTAAALTGGLRLQLPPITYLWILLLAIVPQLIGHSTYNWALGYLPAALVAVTTLGEPVGSAVLAYLVLNERPGLLVLLGAALILAGIFLAVRSRGRTAPGLPKTG